MKTIQTAALLLAVSAGAAMAQGSTPGATSPGTAMPAAATAPSAPAVQAGVGTRNSPGSDNTAKLERGDRKFIVKAAEDGMFEVEIAKLAANKATHADVKSFASMMVEDHTKANSELAQLANARGLELPAATSHGKRRDLEKMAKMSGDKFDRTFAHEVGLEDHRKDIKTFEKASRSVKDAGLKGWIDKTLPTLRAHLAAASKLPQNSRGKS